MKKSIKIVLLATLLLLCVKISHGSLIESTIGFQKEIIEIDEDINWRELVDNANKDSMSNRDSSSSALERDIKRNFEKWGNKDQLPIIYRNDSIIMRVFYTEQLYDLLGDREDCKESILEVMMYTQPFDGVKVLLESMAIRHKELFFMMESNQKHRHRIYTFTPSEYLLFGSKAD